MKPGVAIVGLGFTEIVRRSNRSLSDFALEAALNAIADAGLSRDAVDGYVGAPSAPNASAVNVDGVDEVSYVYMERALGLNARWSMDVEGMAGAMIVAAADAIAAGACNYIVGVRALYNPPDRKYSATSVIEARGADQFTLPYGLGAGGGRFALWLQRYMYETGATREELFEIARVGRENAQRNPYAIWRGKPPLSKDEYMTARWLYEPMCLYDSDMPATAAGAFLMTTSERARDLPHRPAYIAGYANASEPQRLFSSVGITQADIQVAQIYDGFAPIAWHWLERLGFCGKGEAHSFTQNGRIARGGALPINTFGGSLGEGRLHGMGHIREAVLQCMGRAGERQIPNVRYSLAQVGVFERSWITLFAAEP